MEVRRAPLKARCGSKHAHTYVLPRDSAVRVRVSWFSKVVGCSEVDRGIWSGFWS